MPATTADDSLLEVLTGLFRKHGYDGTSLARMMSATGLVKASLYHRFSGGKEEMASAVLERVARTFACELLAPLSAPGDPARRLAVTTLRLRRFYGSGGDSCLLNTMTLNVNHEDLRTPAREALRYWISAFAKFGQECGLSAPDAHLRSEDAVAAIEGGLILARVSGNRQPFLRALDSLPERLIVRTRHRSL